MGELRRCARSGRRGRRSGRLAHREKDERGAVIAFVVLLLAVLMSIAAFAVDIGMHRVTRADLQALADMVALDLAREIQGQTQAELAQHGDFSDASSAVRKSAARNPDVFGQDLVIDVDWGSYEDRVWNTATDPPSAVRVTASADTDYAVTSGVGDSTRTAYAVSSSSACFKLGSFLAGIRSDDSTVLAPMNDLFGVNLTMVGYRGLADADVTLADLAATSTIGSPEELLTGTITYANLISALIEVLSNEPGSSNTVAISALQTLLSASGSIGAVALGDVLHVSPTDQAALGIALNVLDIVGSAALSNGQHFIEVENVQAGVPGVGFQFTGGIRLIAAAQLACGKPNSPEAVARNAQLEGSLGITFANMPSLSIAGLGTLQTAKGTGSLTVSIADGEGQLVSPPPVECGDGVTDPHTYSVSVRTQPASYSLRSELEAGGDVKVSDLQALGLGSLLGDLLGLLLPLKVSVEVKVRLDVATGDAGGTDTANLSIPPNDVTPVETGSEVYLDPRNVVPTVTEVRIGGNTVPLASALPLTNLIVNELTAATNGFMQKTLVPLIDNFNNMLIGPVARMVGLRFGGADVYAVGAVCGQPALWG